MRVILITGIPGTGKTALLNKFINEFRNKAFMLDTDNSPFVITVKGNINDSVVEYKRDSLPSTMYHPYKWRFDKYLFKKFIETLSLNGINTLIMFGVFRNLEDALPLIDDCWMIDPTFEYILNTQEGLTQIRKEEGRIKCIFDVHRFLEMVETLMKSNKFKGFVRYDEFDLNKILGDNK